MEFTRRAAEALVRDYRERHRIGHNEGLPDVPRGRKFCGWHYGVIKGAIGAGNKLQSLFGGGSLTNPVWLAVELWIPAQTGTSLVQMQTGTLSAVSSASPSVLTSPLHGLNAGDTIIITATGTNGIDGIWCVANPTSNSFTLQGTIANSLGIAVGADLGGVSGVTGGAWTMGLAVANRFSSLTGSAGTSCTICSGHGEWRPDFVDC